MFPSIIIKKSSLGRPGTQSSHPGWPWTHLNLKVSKSPLVLELKASMSASPFTFDKDSHTIFSVCILTDLRVDEISLRVSGFLLDSTSKKLWEDARV